ncbi:MAG: hypothetical protein J0653_02840 [Deltaproteobacteria bacterium]|nr:hypothetical protein [Deltaproteobacteria bacterium]
MNGIDLLNTIQQRSAATINAVLVTGETMPERIEMTSSARWEVLFKPIELGALLVAMERGVTP